jgi:cyclin A
MYLLHTQQDIDAHKRLVLVDWLIEVVDEFALSQESLYLAISLLDRFLSLHAVQRCQLQLLGVTCLWVASKYEEVLPPALQVRASSENSRQGQGYAVRAAAVAVGGQQGILAAAAVEGMLHLFAKAAAAVALLEVLFLQPWQMQQQSSMRRCCHPRCRCEQVQRGKESQ